MAVRMQPIRDIDQVHDITKMLSKLKTPKGKKMFLLWMIGISLGLRISDIVDLKVGDLRGSEYTYLPKKQAHKRAARNITIPIPVELKKVIKARCAGMPDGAYILTSTKKTKAAKDQQHITRYTARRYMLEIGEMAHLDMKIGCHTMRKTFGYHYYQATHDLAILQEWFYHSSPSTTLIYIGVSLDNFRKMTNKSPFSNMDGVEL